MLIGITFCDMLAIPSNSCRDLLEMVEGEAVDSLLLLICVFGNTADSCIHNIERCESRATNMDFNVNILNHIASLVFNCSEQSQIIGTEGEFLNSLAGV